MFHALVFEPSPTKYTFVVLLIFSWKGLVPENCRSQAAEPGSDSLDVLNRSEIDSKGTLESV